MEQDNTDLVMGLTKAFWELVKDKSKSNTVLVSEHIASRDFRYI